MELPATLRHQGEKFLHFIVMGDEIWVNHVATTKPQKKPWRGNINHLYQQKESKHRHQEKKIKEHVFWGHEAEIIVDFLVPTDTVHAERFCDTLQGLL